MELLAAVVRPAMVATADRCEQDFRALVACRIPTCIKSAVLALALALALVLLLAVA